MLKYFQKDWQCNNINESENLNPELILLRGLGYSLA